MILELAVLLLVLGLFQAEALQCYNCTSGSSKPNLDCFVDEASKPHKPLAECAPAEIFCSVTYVLENGGETIVERACSKVEEDENIVGEIEGFGYIMYFTCTQDGCNGDDKRVALLLGGNPGNRSAGLPSIVIQLSLTLAALCLGALGLF